MNNDLISRSAVIQEMDNLLKSPYANSTRLGAERREVIGIVKKLCVEKIPTAYDVDKVVEQIKEKGKRVCCSVKCNDNCNDCEHGCLMNSILSIVKEGGISDNH